MGSRAGSTAAVLVRSLLVVVVGITLALGAAGCASPAVPPRATTATGTCAWSAPPANPELPAEVCDTGSTTQTATLGHGADLLPLTIALYTDRTLSCPPAAPDCAVEDNRAFLPAGSPAPTIDPSRSRATITLDWQDRRFTLHQAPRCDVASHPDPRTTSGPIPQTCHTPAPATFQVSTAPGSAAPWHFEVVLSLPGDPGGQPVPAVLDRWLIALDPTTGQLDLTGQGSDTPAFALADLATVTCSDPGSPPPPTPVAPVQHYACHTRVLPNP